MQIDQKKAVWWCVGLGDALLIAAGAIWWNGIYQNPEHVFWATLNNNLSTQSVTRRVASTQSGQSIEEYTQVSFGAMPTAQTRTVVAQGPNKVVSENLATPKESFARWTSIKTNQKNSHGKPLDFSKLINVWGKSVDDANTYPAAVLQSQAGVPLPPIGNLTADQRQQLIDYIRQNNVFNTVYSAAKKQTVNGQPAYLYTVQVPLASYVAMMQRFAHDEGFKNLDQLDPTSYANAAPMTVTMAMGRTSHQLLRVSYADKYTQDFSSYGVQTEPALPSKSIPYDELESRLQKVE